MVSGFIASVQGHIFTDKFLVLAKVRHSQRMNDSLISCWVITEREGTILFAHCLGCKAGLAETCSHIASVLFYLEAWTKINGRLACTQVKCSCDSHLPLDLGVVSMLCFQPARCFTSFLHENLGSEHASSGEKFALCQSLMVFSAIMAKVYLVLDTSFNTAK
ncbi:unnamed protein product [Pocillopora meandrina]|uniref:SWIM-type domain-containing protein n=1 Tax=Pocillopora meandrina TaxID=46732 RepID=A0AAU9VPN2_9CNID|nr:unnamed protein product [Pocillopora meandrina]